MSNLNNSEMFGGRHVHPDIVCKTCVFANGEPPFADGPEKGNCKYYKQELKPAAVYFDGEPCEFHTTKEEAEKAVKALEEERRKFHEQRAKERAEKGGYK